ncbi:integrase family protein [Acinetobacter baumannii]|uniref:gamma-mobile-trio integrase GmtZ n=1 Tax=Acinetobacter baumannii TaxID=470 RepID=UPI000F8D8D6A|nr:integrase family protein [Acinetobacter baumannii]MBD0532007.1 integrase [Acinetobacter baumannii]MCZ3264262.1 integrase family protein [Acinetobacter baumannii]MDC4764603.1 integrase family protein [Acinetobacter baumannii]QTM19000.1 integrase family protein [Acinetobacter baumannii]HAV4716734.1 integrase [Acinetobacter baumannii]
METKTIRMKQDGRSKDLTLQWLTGKYGKKWEAWRQLGQEWITKQDGAVDTKLQALSLFFDIYLASSVPFTADVVTFFVGKDDWQSSIDEFKRIVLEKTNRNDNATTARLFNHVTYFIDWVLDTHLTEKTNYGKTIRLYSNPLKKVTAKRKNIETVHTPLPYRYICDLRHILCPKSRGHFSDWIWAQSQTGQKSGDWFEVNQNLIDKDDKDCVWRVKKVTHNGKSIIRYQIWSPVAAMVLFIKLHLPLRTFQVRMLDSGEADYLRYENGKWNKNQHPFALNSYSKGVFRQFKDNATGLISTGLYISTNKTADQNKDEFERGYEIPWQNEDVLYWLEKLRNWQEKYNPISKQTDCTTLEKKHTNAKKSYAYLSAMGNCCFLFRDASAKKIADKNKPICEHPIFTLWYKLLRQLEDKLLVSGDVLSDGTPLQLVHNYSEKSEGPKTKTEFPLHSLRVSLITCYIMDAKLPLPVVSKMLAGHSRILMTIYYTKITPAVMKEKMTEAEKLLDDNSQESVQIFLKDAEMRQIECKMAYNDGQAIEAALVNRNPLGWENRHHGLCLAGGNTVRSDECKTVTGCWNGGELIAERGNVNAIHGAVPHGPENCIRCRWFITDARYLPALNAHLNFTSYKAHEAANLAAKLEENIEKMEESKYEAEINGKPFMLHNKLQALQRRYEKQLLEADEYMKDWIATFALIRRLIEIEQTRTASDITNKLVAIGSENDIKVGFIETNSELLHLSLLCDDAEIYPDILDDVKKTPIIERLAQTLSRFMMRKGYTPYLLMLDQDQQLIAANAMMRQMALQANPTDKLEGFKQVANYLELGQFMKDTKLLEAGISALELQMNTTITPVSIKSLTNKVANGAFSNAG